MRDKLRKDHTPVRKIEGCCQEERELTAGNEDQVCRTGHEELLRELKDSLLAPCSFPFPLLLGHHLNAIRSDEQGTAHSLLKKSPPLLAQTGDYPA
jgi:hypothetical protein